MCDSNTGLCKCGTSTSCEGLSTGAYCDSTNNVCKCSENLASCAGNNAAPFCDTSANSGNGACKCSQSLAACPTNEVCNNAGSSNAVCNCGTGGSCEGKTTGSYCDGTNCKCCSSPCNANNAITACTDGKPCTNGACVGKYQIG